jgi:hypothetical protein
VRQVSEGVQEKVSAEEFARVGFYTSDAFSEFLKKVAAENPEEPVAPPLPNVPKATKKKGWTVKCEVADVTSEEAREAEERTMRAIAEALRKNTT